MTPAHAQPPADKAEALHELQLVREEAAASGLTYAGSVLPELAWRLFKGKQAVLVDVRTPEELSYVGRVPGALHVVWANGVAQVRNPHFLRDLESKVPKMDAVVLFLCRSGKRSAGAAEAATGAGYANAFNVLEGFEGDLDEHHRRRQIDGWMQRGLPWVQD